VFRRLCLWSQNPVSPETHSASPALASSFRETLTGAPEGDAAPTLPGLKKLTLVLAEISWLLPTGPTLAGSAARVRVSAETNDTEQAFSAELSLGSEFRFPATGTRRK
jgi:hypothetical protein